jgi:hypothetical protein
MSRPRRRARPLNGGKSLRTIWLHLLVVVFAPECMLCLQHIAIICKHGFISLTNFPLPTSGVGVGILMCCYTMLVYACNLACSMCAGIVCQLCVCTCCIAQSWWAAGTRAWNGQPSSRFSKLRTHYRKHNKKYRLLLRQGIAVDWTARSPLDFMCITWLLHEVPAMCRAQLRFAFNAAQVTIIASLSHQLHVVCRVVMWPLAVVPCMQLAESAHDVLWLSVGLDLGLLHTTSKRLLKKLRNGLPVPWVLRFRMDPKVNLHRVVWNLVTVGFIYGLDLLPTMSLGIRSNIILGHILILMSAMAACRVRTSFCS